MISRLSLLLFMSVLLVACGGGGGSDPAPMNPTPPGTPPPVDYDPPSGVQPTLESIQQQVFTPICTQCHAGGAAPNGLRLEAGVAHGMLVGVASVNEPAIQRVVAGDPDNSYLIHKLEGTQNVGARMPFGGPYLDSATITAIRQWIAAGAEPAAPPPTNKVAGTWPVPDGYLVTAPDQLLIVFERELDASRIGVDSVRLLKVDGVAATPVAGAQIAMTSPTTVRVTVADARWSAGRYELQVMGLGPYQLLDKAGRAIDGNGDGYPGGDFVMQFTLAPSVR